MHVDLASKKIVYQEEICRRPQLEFYVPRSHLAICLCSALSIFVKMNWGSKPSDAFEVIGSSQDHRTTSCIIACYVFDAHPLHTFA